MTDAAVLQGQLDSLRSARAGGARRVRFQNGNTATEVEYRTDDEMRAAIADLEGRLAALAGTRPVRNVVIRNSRGW